MKKIFFLLVVVLTIYSCSKTSTNPVEDPKRWVPSEQPAGGKNLEINFIMGSFPFDLPSLPFSIPASGDLRTIVTQVLKSGSSVDGVYIIVKSENGDSVFLKKTSDLNNLYLPTAALPLYPPDLFYPIEVGKRYSIRIQTDSGQATGSVLMPYIECTQPANNDILYRDTILANHSIDFSWSTTNQGSPIDVNLALLQLTGAINWGPIPIPLPDTFTHMTLPILDTLVNTGTVEIYMQAVNLDTINGDILKNDTFILPWGDTMIGSYTFPMATYVSKRTITIQ